MASTTTVGADISNKVPVTSKEAKKPKNVQAKAKIYSEPEAAYIQERIELFDKLKLEYDEFVRNQPRNPIKVSLPDGNSVDGVAWETSPMEIAKNISKSLSEKIVSCKVDGELWDLNRPLEKDCSVKLLTFDDDEGKQVFWHSSAHVLGEACELHYDECKLCLGPPLEEGFYYEMDMKENITEKDYSNLETVSKNVINEKQTFERLEMTKEDLLKMFRYNKFKTYFIQTKVPDNTKSTVYRCGKLIDLCKGPHIPHTGKIKSLMVTKNSSSYWLGDAKNDSIQRLYGISFPDNKMMKEYKQFLEEASKRDHRKIGVEQELFFFNDLSPGSCFFLPNGTKIYNSLLSLQREEYRKRGFKEVITPNMYNTKLWETSGHWQNYSEDMFVLNIEKEKWALKPMNCPGHCVMFKNRPRSHNELPLRFADFGVLHRNEASGALSGLTRVRRFQQDDAHIFCTLDQLDNEIKGCLDFINHVYGIFDFKFHMKLSTRPEKYLGEIETWDKAEKILENALVKSGHKWELNPGDGAFYGPKIDIVMTDALRRKHQCATMQLDFQLPQRFDLSYRTNQMTDERPVMIHRAIFGSLERFIAILTENFAGKWPFWISPKQVVVIPISNKFSDYAKKVADDLFNAGIDAETDLSDLTFNKKIRNAEVSQWNYIVIVGEQEELAKKVNFRDRDDPNTKSKGDMMDLDEFVHNLAKLRESRSLKNSFK